MTRKKASERKTEREKMVQVDGRTGGLRDDG